ncbi:MAG: hypothetical protein IKY82_02445 [Alistipes sp.]|nr:hypothetical protein [Alistipes sp.]
MKTLFSGVFAVFAAAMLLVSCDTKEKYDFEFDMPGSIVTEFDKTLVIPFTARNIVSISVSARPKGWTIENVDIVNSTITIKSPASYTADDSSVEENGTLRLTGYTAAGTSVQTSSYLSLLNQDIDLSDKYANSYVLTQKDTRYYIDVTHKGESNERITPDNVVILWQNKRNMIAFDSYDATTGQYTFFLGHEDITDDKGNVTDTRVPDCNAVVAALDADGVVIWSWHLWSTGSDVESTAIATSVGEFMDRNLGAYHNSNGSMLQDDVYRSYGLYYQWGRKDPFCRPVDYKFSANQDEVIYGTNTLTAKLKYAGAEDGDDVGTLEYAVQNPMTIVLGSADDSYDWLYGAHNTTLWSADKKSVYDPCPRGWRVPDSQVWEAFDIDESEDAAAWGDVCNMYGWHLVDKATGVKMFMPAAGRRSFETGVLSNVNNYGYENRPMPWVGYYWTALAGNGNQSQSLFFDLNTTRAVNNRYEAVKPMYRANGMQVRCVRDNK